MFFNKLDVHGVKLLGLEKSHPGSSGSIDDPVPQELGPLGLEFFKRHVQVLHFQCNMMDSFPPFSEKIRCQACRCSRFDKLDVGFAGF